MKKLDGRNQEISEQINILKNILFLNQDFKKILEILQKSGLKNYYVAAGSINQTVFNYYNDLDLDYGVNDIDIVYFDEDVSYEAEDIIIKKILESLKNIKREFDIKNQARVHLWYKDKFGSERSPYTSVEHAIETWGSTVTCVGVRLENDQFIVCAPYGLNDIFNQVIRPVKGGYFNEEGYNAKSNKWKSKWPSLTIIPWDK